MIIIPLVFALVMFYGVLRRKGMLQLMRALVVMTLVGAAVFLLLPDASSTYITYARTIKDEGLQRVVDNSLGGYLETIRQAGVFGYGLGTATQGSYHLASHGQRTWQEDGLSRLGAELGIPGTLLLLWAMLAMARDSRRAMKQLPPQHPLSLLQAGMLGVLAANAASFLVSHQAYSGDPSSIAIATMCLGFVLAAPAAAEGESRRLTLPPPMLDAALLGQVYR
jgi:hypothetical protein